MRRLRCRRERMCLLTPLHHVSEPPAQAGATVFHVGGGPAPPVEPPFTDTVVVPPLLDTEMAGLVPPGVVPPPPVPPGPEAGA